MLFRKVRKFINISIDKKINKQLKTKSRQNQITFSHCSVRKHRGSDWLGPLDVQYNLHGIGGARFQAGHDVVPL